MLRQIASRIVGSRVVYDFKGVELQLHCPSLDSWRGEASCTSKLKEKGCDGSLHSDPHSSRTCADSAVVSPELAQDHSAGIGCRTPPRELREFKRQLTSLRGESAGNRSWEAPEFMEGKDGETTNEDAASWRNGTLPESGPPETLEDGR
ncbi:hypothetical protein NDU88_001226 [Pleurodeles waltl]|uniref:Uncharacterized protein n=1 Tax=Pleurodeles waltl TaxID=8319 RepID=A0AAV7NAF9_PLEWA|nr:hypothetical protein NDU88_001226 [Pleurodeles waltl]